MRELTCIRCPRGCRLAVAADLTVQGAGCPQGVTYAEEECTRPVRTVTATVRLLGGSLARLPVKSREPVPKEKVMAVVQALRTISAEAPLQAGDIVLPDAAGTGTDIVATRSAASEAGA